MLLETHTQADANATLERMRELRRKRKALNERTMTIPEIRAELHSIADQYGIERLHFLAGQTLRNFHGRAARTTARKITPEISAAVRQDIIDNPGKSHRWYGRRHNIDGGRVCEIRWGYRDGTQVP